MVAKYDSSNIETLRFPENIRRNTSMYLGSTDAHGRWLIARELLDNGLDEALAGRNKANVFVEGTDGTYWVLDYGNGIPQGTKVINVNVNGKNIKSKIPTMQAIFSEMHTSGKFRSEAYQVSVGCFVGDTYVTLCNGNAIRIEELYRAWEKGQREFYLPSVSPETGKFLYKDKITHVQLSKYTKELICVEIDGYIHVTCTPDHPFYNVDLKKVKAEDLKVDDELFDTTFKDKFYGGPKVTNITKMSLAVAVPVYGITVETNHTYMVGGGILVSNTHGVGAKGTNATSEFFDVYTKFEGSWYQIGFERGILKTPVTKLSRPPKGPFGKPLTKGTAIHFKPDAKIFDKKSSIDLSYVRQWAEITSYLTPGFTVLVVDKKKRKQKYYSEKGASEYVTKILEDLKAQAERTQFEFHNELCDVVVAFSTAEACNIRGYTNGLFNSEGGKHVDSVIACLYDSAKKYIKGKQSFSVHNFKEGLVGLVNMKLHKAEFSSQDKSRLTDLRAGNDFKEILKKETDKFFASNKALAQRLCEKASKLSQLMDKFKASKKVVSALNAVKRKGLPAKYAPYDSKTKIEDRELLIVEGDSASGGLREERMPWQSLLPLRGKILNVGRPGKQDKSLESAEIINILGAIGYDPKASDPLSKLQVSKVICLADADPDGKHINALLLTLFHTYLPGMFERGMVYVADMPEFYALYKDQFFSGDTVSEVRKKMNNAKVPASVEINHIKGWGEIDASLMRILAVDPSTRKLIRIEPVKEKDKVIFTKLMAEDVQFRRKLLGLSENV